MSQISNNIKHTIDYLITNVLLKEVRNEPRLLKQLLYTVLSAYTNNPINLLVNAPPGVGKSYTINKVADLFPSEDVILLAGMTDKALFHRQGKLVIRNNESGKYEDIQPELDKIELELLELEGSHANTLDSKTKAMRKRETEQRKKELQKDAKKLIDLRDKILVFLDTPRTELLSAMMPLLSHDRYEVEYEMWIQIMASKLKLTF